MRLEAAIEIVLGLACENVIEEHYAREDDDMAALRAEQLEALATVEDFFVNNVFDTDEDSFDIEDILSSDSSDED